MRRSRAQSDNPLAGQNARRASYLPETEPWQGTWQGTWQADQADDKPGWQAVPPSGGAEDAESQDWNAAFIPSPQGWYYTEPAQQPAGREYPAVLQDAAPEPVEGRGFPLASLIVILASLGILLGCAVYYFDAQHKQAAFAARVSQMKGQRLFQGIVIDGQDVSGMAPGQVLLKQAQSPQAGSPQVGIRLVIDQTAYQFDNSHIPFHSNLEEVLQQAWAIGRQGSLSLLGLSTTPFEYRYRDMLNTRNRPVGFRTQHTYSAATLRTLADGIAGQINSDPVNAIVSSFDFSTREFTVTQDVKGRSIDPDIIETALKKALDTGDFGATILLQSAPVFPRVTSVDLKNSFTMLASFQTKTTSDESRNKNIALAAQAISNRTLMPGETFSFNEATGQRTIQKGYQGAPAILGGVLIDDVGGGVCQVSSTLFCAAANAGMAIVERSPHAWPVSYLDKGMDATVNWPNLDFKFRNDGDTPVFIIASYAKRKLTIEFYGMLNAPGESIQLETSLVSSQAPPSEPILQFNPALPPNTRQELKQARTGYVVDTYRVYLRNGSEYRREKLFTSTYKMVQQVIEYN